MNRLAKLQQTFQDCVLHPQQADSIAWVSASGRATPEVQLSVYSYAYAARLKETLANDYSATLLALGEDAFNQLAEEYIQAYPSRYFSLRDFGCDMPGFIHQHEAYAEMSWLHELAQFEWSLGQAFDAADVSLFTEQDMALIPPDAWPDLKFVLHSSVQRHVFEWNTVAIWQALTAEPPTPISAECETTTHWLIWREQLVTRYRSLPQQEQLALDKLRDGGSFEEVCEVLAEMMDEQEVPLHAASFLKSWIAQGLICEIKN